MPFVSVAGIEEKKTRKTDPAKLFNPSRDDYERYIQVAVCFVALKLVFCG